MGHIIHDSYYMTHNIGYICPVLKPRKLPYKLDGFRIYSTGANDRPLSVQYGLGDCLFSNVKIRQLNRSLPGAFPLIDCLLWEMTVHFELDPPSGSIGEVKWTSFANKPDLKMPAQPPWQNLKLQKDLNRIRNSLLVWFLLQPLFISSFIFSSFFLILRPTGALAKESDS